MNAPVYEYHETLLKMENVSFEYDHQTVLRDTSLEIKNVVRPDCQQGQVVALLGTSGMGKTTMFRLLAGLDTPDAGRILVGSDQRPVERGTVGVVEQNYPLFAHRTVLSNLLIAGKQGGLRGSELRKKAQGLLARFNIEETATKYPCQLSGGQRQRAAIAQQFMCSESLLLMDEPFSGLDVLAQDSLIRFIAEMASQDELMTFILITHDISAALQIADHVWVLGRDRDKNGQVISGARIQASFDLIERGLAWQENVSTTPEFLQLRQEIRDLFPTL